MLCRYQARRVYLTVATLGLLSAAASAQDITTGLVAHWEFDETSGSVAADSSGNGNSGTATNHSWNSDGRIGGCIELDGSFDYVTVTNSSSLQISGQITITAWVRADTVSSQHCIVGHGPTGSLVQNTYLYAWSSTWLAGSNNGSDVYTQSSATAGDWTHLASVYDGSQWLLYVNGVLVDTTTSSQGAINVSGGRWTIGAPSGQSGRFFDGLIDDVRIYNRSLTAADVDALYVDGWATSRLLMTTNSAAMTSEETARKQQFEDWGYAVYPVVDSSSQSAYDTVLALVDVAYIPEDSGASSVAYKLREATVGVVSEELLLDYEMGFSTSDGYEQSSTNQVVVTDNSHPVSTGLSAGFITIFGSAQPRSIAQGTLAAGFETLATASSGDLALGVIEVGGDLANTYNSNNTASGRRVRLPWGGSSFAWSSLDSDGLLIAQQALAWASGGSPAALMAHWTFDEGSGSTVADSSGNGNDASFNTGSPAWVDGVRGGALQFDGTNDVTTDSDFDPPAEGTITFWYRYDAEPTTHSRFLGTGGNWEARAWTDDFVYFDIGGPDGGQIRMASTAVTVDQWRHVAITYSSDNDTYTIYLDGQLDSTGSHAISDDAAATMTLGHRTGANTNHRFVGALDDVRIYNRELTAAEVTEIYGLVGHWMLDEASGTIADDSTLNNNDGTHNSGVTAGQAGPQSGTLAAEYDGSNNFTDVPYGGNWDPVDDEFTLATWVRLDAIGDTHGLIIWSNIASPYALLVNSSNQPEIRVNWGSVAGESGNITHAASGTLALNTWRHVAVTYDGSTVKFYLDGVEDSNTLASAVTIGISSDKMQLGGDDGTSYDLTGSMHDARIYNRALSQDEISELAGNSGSAGLRIMRWVEVQ